MITFLFVAALAVILLGGARVAIWTFNGGRW